MSRHPSILRFPLAIRLSSLSSRALVRHPATFSPSVRTVSRWMFVAVVSPLRFLLTKENSTVLLDHQRQLTSSLSDLSIPSDRVQRSFVYGHRLSIGFGQAQRQVEGKAKISASRVRMIFCSSFGRVSVTPHSSARSRQVPLPARLRPTVRQVARGVACVTRCSAPLCIIIASHSCLYDFICRVNIPLYFFPTARAALAALAALADCILVALTRFL